jgi:hypothetical protein
LLLNPRRRKERRLRSLISRYIVGAAGATSAVNGASVMLPAPLIVKIEHRYIALHSVSMLSIVIRQGQALSADKRAVDSISSRQQALRQQTAGSRQQAKG